MIGAAEPDADVAAVDLGSNSFHMIVARPRGHEITVVDKLREPVRLGAGLGADKQLSPEAHQRAMDCLEQFGQRLRAIPPGRARVVGTNTLRRMRNPKQFLAAAERARQVLLAEAYREAEELTGEGDAESAAIYANVYGQDTEFYNFYRSLDVYRTGFQDRTDILVLEPDSELFRYFKNGSDGR